jgi:hypothetical protein
MAMPRSDLERGIDYRGDLDTLSIDQVCNCVLRDGGSPNAGTGRVSDHPFSLLPSHSCILSLWASSLFHLSSPRFSAEYSQSLSLFTTHRTTPTKPRASNRDSIPHPRLSTGTFLTISSSCTIRYFFGSSSRYADEISLLPLP